MQAWSCSHGACHPHVQDSVTRVSQAIAIQDQLVFPSVPVCPFPFGGFVPARRAPVHQWMAGDYDECWSAGILLDAKMRALVKTTLHARAASRHKMRVVQVPTHCQGGVIKQRPPTTGYETGAHPPGGPVLPPPAGAGALLREGGSTRWNPSSHAWPP